MSKKNKKPWPTKDIMEQIYEKNLWGGNSGEFYSGEGSHNPNIVEPYISAVTEFLKSFRQPPTICDLGCGDFNIGKELAPLSKRYIGVDVVRDLIIRNEKTYKDNHIHFICLDIAEDELPKGDCAILRQVLQHLSNREIQSVVKKLNQYKYLILSEHIPLGDFSPNVDIISGQGIRLKKKSGVNLMKAPFNLKAKSIHKMSSTPELEHGGCIETQLYVL